MEFSRTGVASFVGGIVLLALVYLYAFSSNIVSLIVNGLIVGGLSWLGLILLVLGIFILAS